MRRKLLKVHYILQRKLKRWQKGWRVQYHCENLKAENLRLKKHVNHLDNYSRKSNLVIGGLREKDNESMNQCEHLVGNFFSKKLQLQAKQIDNIQFVRCHRIGRQFNKPRSIIVRFCDFNHRQMMWAARTKLDDNTLTISENFCRCTEFNRRKLYPIYRTVKHMKQGISCRGYTYC